MKKTAKKVLSLVLAITSASSVAAMTACDRDSGRKIDKTKSQLTIGNYEGGLGDYWLKRIAKKFESDYADYSFEDGKTGCQIWIDNRKTEYAGDQLLAVLPYGEASIVCTQSCDYANLQANGVLYDVTDWVSEKVYDENGDMIYDANGMVTHAGAQKSILDSLQSEYEAYYNINDRYFGMPFSQLIAGMWYDADLFNDKGYYFFANGAIGAKAIDIADGLAGKGPDGREGTSDDGLPETWSQFKLLMQTMKTSGVIPFTWDGAHNYQRNWFANAVVASYEGYDDMNLNYSLSGQDSDQPEINVTGADTVGLLANQNGRKAMAYAIRDIVRSGNYSSTAFNGSQTHTGAQREFLESTNTTMPIGMLIEGSFWLNEGREVCNEMEKLNDEWGYYKRNVRYMPIPRFEADGDLPAQSHSNITLSSQLDDTAILVKENLDCEKLVKAFYQYMHSRESMVICETDTLTIRPFDYIAKESEIKAMPKLMQSLRNLIDEGAKIVNNLPKTSLAKNSKTKTTDWLVTAIIDKKDIGEVKDPFYVFQKNSSLTWLEYYEGVKKATLKNWPLD